ncbi:MAG: AhpC/TSA family protein [Bacteroidaceae bacterium]|nr:AhpC/TSA family protein [Bacteroidaceae bacterium]
MRKILSLYTLMVCCLIFLSACKEEAERQTFCIHGTIPGLAAGVEIGLLNAEDKNADEIAKTTVQKAGEFWLEGKVEHPTLCTLTTNNLSLIEEEVAAGNTQGIKWTYTPVFVDNSDMEIQVESYDLMPDAPESADFHIVGSPSHHDYCELVALCGNVEFERPSVEVVLQYFVAHPTSVVSFYAANKLLTNAYNLTAEQLHRMQQTLTECPADTARFQQFVERAQLAEKTTVGSPIVDLDLVTTDGTRCQLADIVKTNQGKTLLIDFWASWCGICRMSTPDIKNLYDTLDRTRFEVISVSCDEDDAAWRKAMQDDQMPWAQYCLTSEGYKSFFTQYQVIGVPYYLLVNSQGKVIANPSGVEAVTGMLAK